MKPTGWILRAFIFAALALTIMAVVMVTEVLSAHAPLVASTAIDTLTASIDKDNSSILADRNNALSKFTGKQTEVDATGQAFPSLTDGQSGINSARTVALHTISENAAPTIEPSRILIPDAQVVDATLISDALYVSETTIRRRRRLVSTCRK